VRPEFIEVVRAPHRADITGNGGVVVELQHSPISAEDIAAREAHYGNMVWLFDATHRFSYVKSGERAFFSFGQTKHIDLCKKPVFLDFGFDVVQVERFTDAITMVSGFGLVRSREWFADTFLSDVLQPGGNPGARFVPDVDGRASWPWASKSPIWKLRHPTKWLQDGQTVIYPEWTEYIKLNYYHYTVGDSENKRLDYDNVIDHHTDIANGWTKESLRQMKEFFCGQAIVLGGLLRVLPHEAFATLAKGTVSATEYLLGLAESHIQAGRLPVLKDSTKQGLIEAARQREIQEYGRPLQEPAPKKERSLFD
jgi:hypothetical protein